MSRRLDLYKIVKIGLKAMKKAKIPLYWSKYSRKDYTIRQHIMLIVLAQYLGNIENTLQIMEYMDKVQKVMKLKKIPHKAQFQESLKGYQSTGSV